MMIHEVTEKVGSHKKRKRLGRGIGSGHGKTCGRGTKGAGSRSGWGGSIRASREGGQMPFFRRIPKRGFSNARFMKEFLVVNIQALEARFEDGAQVTPADLVAVGPLPQHPGLATADIEDAQPIAEVAIVVEQPQLPVSNRIADFDVALGDGPVGMVVHTAPPHAG